MNAGIQYRRKLRIVPFLSFRRRPDKFDRIEFEQPQAGPEGAKSTDGLRNPERSRIWTPAFAGVTNKSAGCLLRDSEPPKAGWKLL
jgi:hypothetical protein